MRKEIVVHYEGKACYEITLNSSFDCMINDVLKAAGDDPTKKICIVSDSQVAEIYLNQIRELLKKQYNHVISLLLE